MAQNEDNDQYYSSLNRNCGKNKKKKLSYVSLLKNVGTDSIFPINSQNYTLYNWRIVASSSKNNKNTGFNPATGIFTAPADGNYSLQLVVSFTISENAMDLQLNDFVGFYFVKNPTGFTLSSAVLSGPVPGSIRLDLLPPSEPYLGIGQVVITGVVPLDEGDTLIVVYDATGLNVGTPDPYPQINVAPVSQLIPKLAKQSIATSLTIEQLKQW